MKRLVICCDGTWNTADQQSGNVPCPTNVIKLAFRVAKHDGPIPQVIFYDQGVGTGNWLDRITGGALGAGLLDNIFDAYRFLVANYELGDELFILGFSRGAYTARSLCGMIRKCGILKRESVSQYRIAMDLYRRADCRPTDKDARDFRHVNSVAGDGAIEIKFLGVWDTVGSLGIPIRGLRWLTRRRYQFHDTELSGSVKHAFQALAIDEHRAPFNPTLWTALPKPDQVVKQVWFCGAHSDVGGGYARVGLSDISLEWMIDAAQSAGLAFDAAVVAWLALAPDPSSEPHDSKRGLYRFTRGIDRRIGLNTKASRSAKRTAQGLDATQSLHPTVLVRWRADPTYRPPSLIEYFRSRGISPNDIDAHATEINESSLRAAPRAAVSSSDSPASIVARSRTEHVRAGPNAASRSSEHSQR